MTFFIFITSISVPYDIIYNFQTTVILHCLLPCYFVLKENVIELVILSTLRKSRYNNKNNNVIYSDAKLAITQISNRINAFTHKGK